MELIERIKRFVSGRKPVWSGNYNSWKEASAGCSNYSDQAILEKVRNSLLEVKSGRAAFERDSVLFFKPEYNWPFLSSLLWAFGREDKLTIIDFGGSLGSLYFQHRKWLGSLHYSWNVVEQSHFVSEGRSHFENNVLRFFHKVEDVSIVKPSFLILSSVLAYLPDPYEWLARLLDMRFDYIFIDRTPLIEGNDRLTIQNVPKEIYEATYPAWFFNQDKFTRHLLEHYEIVADYDCNEKADFPAIFRGFLLTLKK